MAVSALAVNINRDGGQSMPVATLRIAVTIQTLVLLESQAEFFLPVAFYPRRPSTIPGQGCLTFFLLR